MMMDNERFAIRSGRVAFGVVAIAGAAFLLYCALHRTTGMALRFAGVWSVAYVAMIAVRARARAWTLPRAKHGGGRIHSAPRDSRALATLSLVLPAIGIALLLPLTLHMPFALLFSGMKGFDEWTELSVVVVGTTHLAFATCAGIRAYQLAHGNVALSPPAVVTWSLFATCVPIGGFGGFGSAWVAFAIVAGILVAITAAPIVPLLYRMQRIAEADREPMIPYAVARAA